MEQLLIPLQFAAVQKRAESGSKKSRMTAILVIAFLGGFHGGRDVALSQLHSCWEEGGIQARPI